MDEPYQSNDSSYKNSFGVKKLQPSKVESYLEVNAWTDWWQQEIWYQNMAKVYHTEHINTTLDIL